MYGTGMQHRITVVGAGYVGLSNAVLLAQHHPVTVLDIDAQKINALAQGTLPFADADMQAFLASRTLQLSFTTSPQAAYAQATIVIVATPTNYDPETNAFDTRSVESVIQQVVQVNPQALLIIKSTVPVGFTVQARARFASQNIVFSPEFLREGKALHDNLFPSRIVVGERSERARDFARLMQQGAVHKEAPVLLTDSTEAEAIKLFANTYLAMRVSFFNELDTFAAVHGLQAQHIVQGVSLDPRIGGHYNNPSFGYGGYCLPKDTRQMLANYHDVPQNLIRAIVDSNATRKQFIADDIIRRNPGTVGIHRLVMKASSDNFRSSSVVAVMGQLVKAGLQVIVYEPGLTDHTFMGCRVVCSFHEFVQQSDLIVANRVTPELHDVLHKVYSRDLFGRDE